MIGWRRTPVPSARFGYRRQPRRALWAVTHRSNNAAAGFSASDTFVGGDDREYGVGEHDEGGVAVPGGPAIKTSTSV
jgi:hypothetical protein